MFEIGWTELLLVGVLAIVLLKPSDMPDTMRSLGRGAAKLKRMLFDLQRQFRDTMYEADLQDVHKAIEDVRDLRSLGSRGQIAQALTDVKTDIERSDDAKS